MSSPHAAEVAAVASDFEVDYYIDYALTQSLHHLKELWVPAFQRGELSFGGSGNRISSVLQRVDSKELLTSVRSMAKSDDVSAATKLGITKTLAAVGSPKDLSLVLQAATNLLPKDNAEVLHALANAHQDRSVKPTGFDPLSSLIASKDSGVRMQAIELTGLWKVRSLTDRVVAIASDRHEQNEVRVAAIQALSNLGGEDAAKMLRRIASEKGGQQVAAIRSLCRLDLETAVELTSQLLSKEPTLADAEYSELVDAFAGRKDGFAKLAAHIDGKTFSASTATKLLDALNGFGITDERLVSQLMALANRSRSLPEYSEEFVAELVSEISKGDPHRGATLFHSKQANCTACHQVSGQGGVTGPDLSGVGTTLPKDRLVQEVLWPQRLVKEGYSLRQVITEDGEVLQGYVRKSRNKKVVLLRPLDSEKLISIPKETIEFQQDIGSAMPENIVATLSPDERIDLLAFLGQLGTPDGFTRVANEVKVP